MKKIFAFIAALLLGCMAFAQPSMNMTPKGQDCQKWIAKNFAKGVVPPFSFTLDGVPSGKFIKKWKFSAGKAVALEDGTSQTSFFWTDPASGLQVECTVKTFADFNAMEWVLYFRNTGSANSAKIAEIKSVDLSLAAAKVADGDWRLFYARGSYAGRHDFMAMDKGYAVGESMEIVPELGRSSSNAWPYFNVKTPLGGMVFAIGWTGSWKAGISRPSEGNFAVSTGFKNFDAYLRPGEQVRTPLTAMIPWQGEDRMDGQNVLRRFIYEHHFPKVDGKQITAPVCAGFGYGDPAPCNEYTCLTAGYGTAVVQRYEQFGLIPDVFWLDAGWYEKSDNWEAGYNWYNTVGNWEPDAERFPNGLRDLADAAHSVGSKLMVWYEPERAIKNSDWAVEHPEYFIEEFGRKVEPVRLDSICNNSFLFNMGDPEALDWLCKSIEKSLRDNKIDYYRQDYNIDPEIFWISNDEPDRLGICENRYVQGLYKYWDYLMEKFPGLWIDNCASGGRRLDLEATSRSIPLWRTDYSYGESNGYQSHTYGISQWLPVSGTAVYKDDPYSIRSSFNAAVTINWKVTCGGCNIITMRDGIKQFRDVKDYFLEDFYPLTGYGDTTGDDICLAYQLHKASDGTGRVLAFRRQDCQTSSIEVKLRGLEAESVYVVENQDTMEKTELTGAQIAAGFSISLPTPRSSAYFKYWKK